MNLFYSLNICLEKNEVLIDGQENKHLIKALRKNIGDKIFVTDGNRNLYNCEIIKSDKFSTILNIINIEKKTNNNPKLKIAIALTKNINRFEWFLEKSTEMGVYEITPLITKFTERCKLNLERSKRILISATKQSIRFNLPKLNKPTNFNDYIDQENKNFNSFICTCTNLNIPLLSKEIKSNCNLNILVGPEGGFSKDEINLAKNAKFVPVSLGDHRLRTETAGILACSIFILKN